MKVKVMLKKNAVLQTALKQLVASAVISEVRPNFGIAENYLV